MVTQINMFGYFSGFELYSVWKYVLILRKSFFSHIAINTVILNG